MAPQRRRIYGGTSLAATQTGLAAGRWNWTSCSMRTVWTCASWKTHLHLDQALRSANYLYHQTDCPTRGGPAILVRRGTDHYTVPVSDMQHLEVKNIRPVLVNRPINVVAVYLSPTRPLIKSNLTERLSGGILIPCPDGGWSQREASGLKFFADHSNGLVPAWLCQRKILLDLWVGLPFHGSLPTQFDPLCSWYSSGQGRRPSGTYGSMPCIQFGSLSCLNRQNVSNILPKPIGPPRLHAKNELGHNPGLPGRQTPGEFCGERHGGNRQVHWGAHHCQPRGPSVICSQASTTCRHAASITR
jgi:hypothetical protein